MVATQTGIEQHREHVEYLRNRLELLERADNNEADIENVIDKARYALNVAETELEEWERDLERSPIDAHVVALDETSHWSIEAKYAPYIKSIRGVYLFDRNEITHCCEITPSHYLIHLYDQVVLTDLGDELDDDAKEEIYSTYEYTGQTEDKYIHCHSIEGIIAKGNNGDHYHDGNVNVSFADVTHEQQMEALREHLACNHYI